MARTAVALCLLVVASALAIVPAAVVDGSEAVASVSTGAVDASTDVPVAAAGVVDASTGVVDASTGVVDASSGAIGLPTGVVDASTGATGLPTGVVDASSGADAVQPGACGVRPGAGGDRPYFTFIPDRTTVPADEEAVLLICIVNPSDSTEPLDVSLVVAHDGGRRDVSVLLVGPDVGPAGNLTQQVASLDTRMRGGRGHFVSPGELPPGTGAQYAIVVEPGTEPGEYEFEAEIEWENVDIEQLAVLRVESPCGVGCHLDAAGREFGATVAAGGTYLLDHPAALISFLGLLVAIAAVAVDVLSPGWLRDRIGLAPRDGDDDSGDGDDGPDRGD